VNEEPGRNSRHCRREKEKFITYARVYDKLTISTGKKEEVRIAEYSHIGGLEKWPHSGRMFGRGKTMRRKKKQHEGRSCAMAKDLFGI